MGFSKTNHAHNDPSDKTNLTHNDPSDKTNHAHNDPSDKTNHATNDPSKGKFLCEWLVFLADYLFVNYVGPCEISPSQL
jgi:hypothetical protein